jgi:hypothetical protein
MSKVLANAAGIISLLWEKLDKDAATDGDLDFLSDASEESAYMAICLKETVSGIGCLVLSDQQPGLKSGALQGPALASLMFTISGALDTISELSRVGHEASYLLRERLAAKADKKSRRVRPTEDSSGGGL